jgi:hypothetical protein
MELKHYAYYVSWELFSFPYSNTWYMEKWFTVSQLHHETYIAKPNRALNSRAIQSMAKPNNA